MLLQACASRRDACQRDVCAMVHARFGGVHAMVLCVRDGMCVRCCGGVRATVCVWCVSAVVHERWLAYDDL